MTSYLLALISANKSAIAYYQYSKNLDIPGKFTSVSIPKFNGNPPCILALLDYSHLYLYLTSSPSAYSLDTILKVSYAYIFIYSTFYKNFLRIFFYLQV